MPITKTRTLYEVLFRFDATGKIQGCHASYLDSIVENGVVIQAQQGVAMPVSLLDVADKLTVKQLLGTMVAPAIAAKEAAEALAAALGAENIAKDANIQALLAENEALKAEAAKLNGVLFEGNPGAVLL